MKGNREGREVEKSIEKIFDTNREFAGNLFQLEKMATLGIFTASIIHELNNPSNAISQNLVILEQNISAISNFLKKEEIAKEVKKDEELLYITEDLPDLVLNLKVLSDQFINLLKNLKNFYKQEEIKPELLSLNLLAKEAIETVKSFEKNKINFILEAETENIKMMINRGKLFQILINLLVNSVQAVSKNEGVIKVKIKEKDSKIFIEISDNGCGMEKEVIENAFTPFYTTKSAKGGTGMGLYVVKRNVQELGGMITLNSKAGEYTLFQISLPNELDFK